MESLGDANSQYDAYENYSRAISPAEVTSPHLATVTDWESDPDGRLYTRFRHPITGHIYERADLDRVEVTELDGEVSVFDSDGTWLEGKLTQADPHLCLWIGGEQLPKFEDVTIPSTSRSDFPERRSFLAERKRKELVSLAGDTADSLDIESICDAELIDAIFFSVFPNWHPWGCLNPIQYRFRPNGDNPDECIFECMLFLPSPLNEGRPPPAPVHWLAADDDWTLAPQLGMLAKVFYQVLYNLPQVQLVL